MTIFVCAISGLSMAETAPAEKTSAQINRLVDSGNRITGSLSKNLFKTESYQVPYVVQVPYQDTETYTVEVPYQDTETYQETVPYEEDESYTVEVPYQDTEYYTVEVPYQETETYEERVSYTVDIPYMDYETDYRQEHRCQDVTRYRQDCHNEQKCYLVPGGQQCRDVEECGVNVHGQRICKTRRVCEDGQPSQRCETKQICQNIPYTERECSYVQVPYQREVTKYRTETRYRDETRTRTVTKYRSETRTRTVDRTRTETRTRTITKYRTETRTRTVTKYRTETRTRTVTKYREEQKCCKTETREVFDKQLQYQVVINFPQEAQLIENESEVMIIKLITATAATAEVQLQIINSIFGYRIASQSVTGSTINIELALIPKFDLINAGATSIKGLRVSFMGASQKFLVSFSDSIQAARVRSAYSLVISDLKSGAQLEVLKVERLSNGQLGAWVKATVDPQAKIKATLNVKRSGVVVAGSAIEFKVAATSVKRALLNGDISIISDLNNIDVTLSGEGPDSVLIVNDLTDELADVASQYELTLELQNSDDSSVKSGTQVLTREQLKNSMMRIDIAALINSAQDEKVELKSGDSITYSLSVVRTGTATSLLKGKAVNLSVPQGIIVIK